MIRLYGSSAEAERAAKVGEYVMFRYLPCMKITEWTVMTETQRMVTPDGTQDPHFGWDTWIKKGELK